MNLFKIVLTIILVSIATLSVAQSTSVFDANYFDKGNASPPIKVGKGFHINDIYKQTRSCFTQESSHHDKLTPQQVGGKKTSIKLFYTRTNEEFNRYTSHGYSGKISFLNLFSFGGQKLKQYSNTSIEDQERLIFSVNVDFGMYSFDEEPALTAEAKALIEQKKLQEFINMYGTHYVSGIKKESSIYVILTKTGSKEEINDGIQTSFQAGGKVPYKVSGSFEIDNGNWLNTQLEKNEFSISVEINGPSISKSDLQYSINEILNGPPQDKANAISRIIEGAIGNISDPSQSSITQYYYSPFSLYGLDGIYWDDQKQQRLTKINEAVIEVYSAKSQLDELISGTGREQLERIFEDAALPEEYSARVTAKYNEILPTLTILNTKADKYLKELEVRYAKCASIVCQGNLECCNNDMYISEISKFNFEQKIESELSKVMTVVNDIVTELLKPECEKKQQGIVYVENTSYNPYNLYQEGNFIETIPGKTTQMYYLEVGTYYFKAIQESGYLLYPTENIRKAVIESVCQEIILKIGFED